ncbi:elongation factor G [Rhodobium orientis]|uniref:Elongation factor G n=1 Tax=Rhodobium orientis TaxID=34017 RepID=A0A327JVM0_9HYPH|nr:elongation factor G [Rhodobium orientis]MBK5949789.1 elongation factor G [Rhodobium orientis]RAI30101.1 elongation factor G [Rhodobium orientis]
MGDGNGRETGPRCIALVGPFGSGKTTLFEAILARTGAIDRQGTVAEGNTVGDASPEARAHAMSVEANVAELSFMDESYTLIDCPGSVEFLHETDAILPGIDLAIVVAEPDEKKVPALQLIMKALEDRGVPRVLFVNKLDKAEGSVRENLNYLQTASSVPLVLRQIPIRTDGAVSGFIDLALERAYIYHDHAPSEMIEIPDDERAREVEARFSMLEKIADYDDDLMEQLLEDVEPKRDTVFHDLVQELQDGVICPVFIGSAEGGNGIFRLLKALRHEAPGIDATCGRLGVEPGSNAVLQVMKTFHTPHGGKMSVARVLSGSVSDGDVIYRGDGNDDRISAIYTLMGQQTTKHPKAVRGETVALGKVDMAKTGDTLTDAKGGTANLVTLEAADPVLAIAIRPTEHKDDVKLSASLAKIVEEDPSLKVSHNQDTGETLLEGQGEMHLRVVIERLTAKYGISVERLDPEIPYKETIRGSVTQRGRHKKQSGGHGQFGDVVLDIKPLPRGEGFVFSDTITGGVVPKQYIPSVQAGVEEYLATGPLGFPVVDVAVTLTDGSYHSVDSSDQAFKMAAQIGMREGMAECKPVLLEPILEVSVVCPSDATAKVNAIVSGRRGQLLGFDARPGWPGWDEVKAMMPQAEIQDLIIELRSATQGVASYTARFDHLQELTGRLAEQVLERHGKQAA